jgi:hypothetical protein
MLMPARTEITGDWKTVGTGSTAYEVISPSRKANHLDSSDEDQFRYLPELDMFNLDHW